MTFVKSPKGIGKTYQLERLIERYKSEHKGVLLIGHRRALLRNLSNRLGLDYYEVHKKRETADNNYFTCCLNSIRMIDRFFKPYDVVILDECQQVLSHLIGGTLQQGTLRNEVTRQFVVHLEKAKVLYILDADLGHGSGREGQ